MRFRQSNFRLLIETNSLDLTKEIDEIGHFFHFLRAISEALTQSISEIGVEPRNERISIRTEIRADEIRRQGIALLWDSNMTHMDHNFVNNYLFIVYTVYCIQCIDAV